MNIQRRICALAIAVPTALATIPCTAQALTTLQETDTATASTAPSVAGASYDALPVANPTVRAVSIDNSSQPVNMRNPIGQKEGIDTPDNLDKNYYSADAAALTYDNKLFVFTGHDEAAETYGSFNMKNWGVYVTDDPAGGKWTHYTNILQADVFDWATGDGAYAGHVVVDDAGTQDTSDDWFYYYIPVKDKGAAPNEDPFSIGVARSKSPLGPWEDAIGKPLLTTSQTGIETIDPAFFTDDDGTGYLYFGTFNSQLAVRMQKDEHTGRTSYTQVQAEKIDGNQESPIIFNMRDADAVSGLQYDASQDIRGGQYAKQIQQTLDTRANGGAYANGPKGFFEAAWVFKKDGLYYNVYDGGKPGSGNATCVESNYQACIQYSTSTSPLGPWQYQGVLLQHGTATTMHPSVLPFNGRWWVTYHTADKPLGTDFRRSVAIDAVQWYGSTMKAEATPTALERIQATQQQPNNVAPYAKVGATYTETASYKGAVNDGRVLKAAVVPPNHWTNYRSMPQQQSGDVLIYQWPGTVTINSARVFFDTDSNALRAPQSWVLQYLDNDDQWHEVPNPSAYTTTTGYNKPNVVTFDAITTRALALHMHAAPVDSAYASLGVAEWEVYSANTNSAEITPISYDKPAVRVSVTGATGNEVDNTGSAETPREHWITSSALAVVQAGVPEGSALQTVEISIAGGAWQPVQAMDMVPIQAQGSVEVRTRITDDSGKHAESSTVAHIDTQAPIITPHVDGATRVLTLEVSDGDGSGVEHIEYRFADDSTWQQYKVGDEIRPQHASKQRVFVRATDTAGNVAAEQAVDIPSDISAPLTGYIEQDATALDPGKAASSWTKGAAALNDGITVDQCHADNACMWATWPKVGDIAVQYEWDRPVLIDSSRVQFVSDSADADAHAGLRIPASWTLQYWDAASNDGAGAWVDIPNVTYTTVRNAPENWGADHDGWSEATWETPVETTKLQLITHTDGTDETSGSPAIVEWQVHAPEQSENTDPDPEPDPEPDVDPDHNANLDSKPSKPDKDGQSIPDISHGEQSDDTSEYQYKVQADQSDASHGALAQTGVAYGIIAAIAGVAVIAAGLAILIQRRRGQYHR